MMCRAASLAFNVIPAQAGIHATSAVHPETCVGARLRGHDAFGWECA
jgi:hypothetical protein